MFQGYVESLERIEARRRRILAGYKKPAKRTKRATQNAGRIPTTQTIYKAHR